MQESAQNKDFGNERDDEESKFEVEDDKQFKGDACMIYLPSSPNPFQL